MKTVKTNLFGEIIAEDDKIIHFPDGIIGFPELKDFTLLHDKDREDAGMEWLQSLDEGGFAMPVMDPKRIKHGYGPEVSDEQLKSIDAKLPDDYTYRDAGKDDLLVLVTITIPEDVKKMSINLKAPIIINTKSRKAIQVIQDNAYPVKEYIYAFLELRKKLKEVDKEIFLEKAERDHIGWHISYITSMDIYTVSAEESLRLAEEYAFAHDMDMINEPTLFFKHRPGPGSDKWVWEMYVKNPYIYPVPEKDSRAFKNIPMNANEAWKAYAKGVQRPDSFEEKEVYVNALHRVREAAKEGYVLCKIDEAVRNMDALGLGVQDKAAIIRILEEACM